MTVAPFIDAMLEADRHLDDAKRKLAEAIEMARLQPWPANAIAAADLGAEAERILWSAASALFKGNRHGWIEGRGQ